MRGVSAAFARPAGWTATGGPDEAGGLRALAEAFVFLQERRHDADYNVSKNLARTGAMEAVERAEAAVAAWEAVRKSEAGTFFLLAMLLGGPRT